MTEFIKKKHEQKQNVVEDQSTQGIQTRKDVHTQVKRNQNLNQALIQ